MEHQIAIITYRIIEVGLWKFYLVSAGLLLVFVLNALDKKKTLLSKMGLVSSGTLFLITIVLTLLAQYR